MVNGLLAAGILLIAVYMFGIYLRGPGALYDALNPFALKTYFALLPLGPGALLLWLSDQLSSPRRIARRPARRVNVMRGRAQQ
jgi:hypothetical protein